MMCILGLALLLIVGCAKDKDETELYFESDTLGYQLIDSTLLKLQNFKPKVSPINNRHNTTIIDTLIEYQEPQVEAIIYKSAKGLHLRYLNITKPEFLITSQLYVNADQNMILKRLNIQKPIDVLKIGPLEQLDVYEINFSNGKVDKIVFVGYDG